MTVRLWLETAPGAIRAGGDGRGAGRALPCGPAADRHKGDRLMKPRQMHLGIFVLGTGNHVSGWRHPGAATSNRDFATLRNIAAIAERGRFDLFFLGDSLMMDPKDHPSFVDRFEPVSLLSALSVVTSHIGLGATMS